jgi:hypothetical protein
MSDKTPKRIRRRFDEDSRYYIDKDEYTKELENYVNTEKCSDRLGELFMLHVQRCASAVNFKNYTYRSDMESTALIHLLNYSTNFDSSGQMNKDGKANAFSYCTTIIHRAFQQVIIKEKKHSKLKDKLIKDQDKINHESRRFSILDSIED